MLAQRRSCHGSKPGDLIFDPFFGSGTTGAGALAERLGRDYLGVERDPAYAALATTRIAAVTPIDDPALLMLVAEKRREPRVPFGSLVEQGLIAPGEVMSDAGGRWFAKVRADGSLVSDDGRAARSTPSAPPPCRARRPAAAGPSGTSNARANRSPSTCSASSVRREVDRRRRPPNRRGATAHRDQKARAERPKGAKGSPPCPSVDCRWPG